MTEADDQAKLLKWCNEKMGLLARKLECVGNRGWPDIFVASPHTHQSVFIELKVKGGKLTQAQKVVGERLRKAGQNYAVCWSLEEAKMVVTSYCAPKEPLKFGSLK